MPVRAPPGTPTGPTPAGGYVSPSGLMYSPDEWQAIRSNTGKRAIYYDASGTSVVRDNPEVIQQTTPQPAPAKTQPTEPTTKTTRTAGAPLYVSLGGGMVGVRVLSNEELLSSRKTTVLPPVEPGYIRAYDPVQKSYVDYERQTTVYPDDPAIGAPVYNALIGVSDRANKYVPETPVDSHPIIKYPAAFGLGFAEFFTNLPGAVGVAGATVEYAVRYPKMFSEQVPGAAKKGVASIITSAKEDPVRFAGAIAAGIAIGRIGPKGVSRAKTVTTEAALDARLAVKNRFFPRRVTTPGIVEPTVYDASGRVVNLGATPKPIQVKPTALLMEAQPVKPSTGLIRVTPEYATSEAAANKIFRGFPTKPRDIVPVYEIVDTKAVYRGIKPSEGSSAELVNVFTKINQDGDLWWYKPTTDWTLPGSEPIPYGKRFTYITGGGKVVTLKKTSPAPGVFKPKPTPTAAPAAAATTQTRGGSLLSAMKEEVPTQQSMEKASGLSGIKIRETTTEYVPVGPIEQQYSGPAPLPAFGRGVSKSLSTGESAFGERLVQPGARRGRRITIDVDNDMGPMSFQQIGTPVKGFRVGVSPVVSLSTLIGEISALKPASVTQKASVQVPVSGVITSQFSALNIGQITNQRTGQIVSQSISQDLTQSQVQSQYTAQTLASMLGTSQVSRAVSSPKVPIPVPFPGLGDSVGDDPGILSRGRFVFGERLSKGDPFNDVFGIMMGGWMKKSVKPSRKKGGKKK